jgi:hypothetical protein
MVSRQTQSLRRQAVTRLHARVDALSLVVRYDETAHRFVVYHIAYPAVVLYQGRYEVVSAWIDGLLAGTDGIDLLVPPAAPLTP